MSLFFPSKCVACHKTKLFTRVRVYHIPKRILKDKPHLAPLQGMSSDGELCGNCFKSLKKLTNII